MADTESRRKSAGTKDGSMTLTEHLRELRSRLVKSLAALVITTTIGWIYYDTIFRWLQKPFDQVIADARANGQTVELAFTGVADPFVMQLQVAAIAGLILAAPVWLYQLWRFVTPGLHGHERRWAIIFVAVATPLFLAGVALAYVVLPYALQVLIGFTPNGVVNIVSVDRYLSFFIRTVIVFGIGFLTPLIIVLLNFAGILSAKKLISWWRWILFLIAVFAAVATPTGDPINMALLGIPILILMVGAIAVCWLNDRRRARKHKEVFGEWDDDETSEIDTRPSAL